MTGVPLVAQVCDYMDVDPERLDVEIFTAAGQER